MAHLGGSVTLALLGALAAALLAGLASVLQARSAMATPIARGVDPRLFARLLRSRLYLLGLACTAGGFLLSISALRALPLFVVQAVRASSLAVTAILSVLVLRAVLRRAEKIAVVVVGVGLLMLAVSAQPDRPPLVSLGARWWLVVAVVVVAVAAVVVGRLPGSKVGVVLGVCAGAAFGLLGVGARALVDLTDVVGLLSDPAAWAMGFAGLLGLLLLATALQRSSVTSVTAAMVATETVGSALLGLVLFGDRPAAGLGWLAVAGFVFAVGGALELARHGVPAVAVAVDSGTAPDGG